MNRVVYAIVTHSTKYLQLRHLAQAPTPSLHSLRRCYAFVVGEKLSYITLAAVAAAVPGSHAPLSQRKKQLRSFLAGIERDWQHRSGVCTAPQQVLSSSPYCKSLLREAVCVATAAAARACRLPALLRSPPAYLYALQSLS